MSEVLSEISDDYKFVYFTSVYMIIPEIHLRVVFYFPLLNVQSMGRGFLLGGGVPNCGQCPKMITLFKVSPLTNKSHVSKAS